MSAERPILIVDDDDALRETLAEQLSLDGEFGGTEAANIAQAEATMATPQGRFDAIILDPPTFGRGGSGKTFRVERDFAALLADALKLARPGAAILLSTNFSEWTADRLVNDVLRLVPAATIRKIPAPPDFFGNPPSATVWLHV